MSVRMTKPILQEVIVDAVKKTISEMLAVSEDVIRETEQVKKEILDIVEKTKVFDKNGNAFSHTVEPINIFGYTFSADITYNHFSEKILSGVIESPGATCSFNNKTLSVSFYSFGDHGIDENTFSDQLQHEIEHIYQRIKKGKDIFSERSKNYYDICAKHLGSGDRVLKNLAIIGYFSQPAEQDAFCNGLYAFLKTKKVPDIDKMLEQTDAIRCFTLLNIALNDTHDEWVRHEYEEKAKTVFKKNIKTIVDTGYKASRRFKNKIEKVIKRIKLGY